MKVISLLQPWATLVVIGAKKIETRSWNTKYRGELLIHASRSRKHINLICAPHFIDFLPHHVCKNNENKPEIVVPLPEELPFGAIIGKVNLVDTFRFDEWTKNHLKYYRDHEKRIGWEFTEQEIAFGDYSPGRYGWLLSYAVQFETPIPAKGALSIWNYDIKNMNHAGNNI